VFHAICYELKLKSVLLEKLGFKVCFQLILLFILRFIYLLLPVSSKGEAVK